MGGSPRRVLRTAVTLLLVLGAGSGRAQSTRSLERRCRAGDGAACESLGQKEEERGSGERALGYYEKACERHVATACTRAGTIHEGQLGVEADRERAAHYAERACKLGDGSGCRNLGSLLSQGRAGKKNLARAAALFEEACDNGDAKGCALAANLKRKKDPRRAAALLRAACDAGHEASCAHVKGAVPGGSERAGRARRACDDGDALACVTLGYVYLAGVGADKDEERAAALFDSACDAGEASACRFLASLYQRGEGVQADDGKAEQLVQKACTLDPSVCPGAGEVQ